MLIKLNRKKKKELRAWKFFLLFLTVIVYFYRYTAIIFGTDFCV